MCILNIFAVVQPEETSARARKPASHRIALTAASGGFAFLPPSGPALLWSQKLWLRTLFLFSSFHPAYVIWVWDHTAQDKTLNLILPGPCWVLQSRYRKRRVHTSPSITSCGRKDSSSIAACCVEPHQPAVPCLSFPFQCSRQPGRGTHKTWGWLRSRLREAPELSCHGAGSWVNDQPVSGGRGLWCWAGMQHFPTTTAAVTGVLRSTRISTGGWF